jgi:hypothetical protein
MSVTALRETTIQFTGDLELSVTENAPNNTNSPGVIAVTDLVATNNTITVPTAGSTQPTAVTIIPPGGVAPITIKGTNGDSGIALHTTGPTTIALYTTTSFVLAVTTTVAGVRLVWS